MEGLMEVAAVVMAVNAGVAFVVKVVLLIRRDIRLGKKRP